MTHLKSFAGLILAIAASIFDRIALVGSPPSRCSGGIAIVRLDAIGDFILWLDAAKALRELYSGQKITLIGNADWLNLAETIPYWDELIPVDVFAFRRNAFYRWRLLRTICYKNFSLAIQPTFSRTTTTGDSVVRATKAPERIGFDGDLINTSPFRKRISDAWYTILVKGCPGQLMELPRNAEFVRALGAKEFHSSAPILPKCGASLTTDTPYFVVSPGAGWSGRAWPWDRFAQVAELLHARTGWNCVVCGSDRERELANQIVSVSGRWATSIAGETTLSELTQVIARARLFIGNESSGIHFSAALDVPSLCILGGGHYGRFLPYNVELTAGRVAPNVVTHHMECYGCNWQCPYLSKSSVVVPCISGISAAEVWIELNALLNSIGTTPCREISRH